MRKKLGKKIPCNPVFSKDSCRVELPNNNFYCRSAAGSEDFVECYDAGRDVAVCSMNVKAHYVCVEIFDKNGCKAICFADPDDCREIFGNKLQTIKLKSYCQRLLKEI